MQTIEFKRSDVDRFDKNRIRVLVEDWRLLDLDRFSLKSPSGKSIVVVKDEAKSAENRDNHEGWDGEYDASLFYGRVNGKVIEVELGNDRN